VEEFGKYWFVTVRYEAEFKSLTRPMIEGAAEAKLETFADCQHLQGH